MAVSQGYSALVAEIDRVVTSPYPASLKQVHTVVCQQCSDLDISHWASARPCQIDSLAQNALEALQQWPYVLEIITKLSINRTIRDALLKRHPTLLFEIVSQAVTGSWQHNAAAIAMLSNPLPKDVTLPAAGQNLFLGIVDHAVQSPSTLSIKPVYLLLQGGLAPLLGLLPNETLDTLESQFLNVLRSTIGQEDQCLSLYCLAIMKVMVTAASEDVSSSSTGLYQTQELLMSASSSPRWKPKGMQQYFAGGKAHKTLHLIALRVIWASRVTAEDAVDETSELLTLSTEIIKYLPEEIRAGWCSENPILVRKLQDRASQSDLDVHVQLQALAFISNLCKPQRLPDGMARSLAHILSEPSNLTTDLTGGDEPSIACLASMLSVGQITEVVVSVTSFIVEGERHEIVRATEAVPQVLMNVSSALSTHDTVANGTLAALSSSGVTETLTQLRRLLRDTINPSQESEDGICEKSLLRARKVLASALCGLYLKAALLADHTQTDVASDLYPLLIEVHLLSATALSSCDHFTSRPGLQASERPARTSNIATKSKDWRQALGQHFELKAKNEHDQITRLFSDACADLEQRCANVEAPLREEQGKRAELQQLYDDLSRAYTDLEDEKSRIADRVHAADTERTAFSQELEDVRNENDELLSRVDVLEARLQQSRTEAEQSLAALKRSSEMTEMEQAATIAKQEEHLDELNIKLAGMQADLRSKDGWANELRHQLEDVRKRNSVLESDVAAHRSASDEQSRILASAERAKQELDNKCTSMLAELQALQDQLSLDKQSYESGLAHVREEAQNGADVLQRDYDDRARAFQEQHQVDLDRVTHQLAAHRDESRRAEEEYSGQIAKREKKLSEMARKVDHLKTVCSDKDDQIAEANAMRTNLMAAMGLGNMRTQGTQPANRRATRSATTRDEAFDNTDISLSFLDIPASTKASTVPHRPDISTSGSQGDPSPKRAKPRKSVVAVSPARARVSTASRGTRNSLQGRSTSKRQPLLAISGNRTPLRAGAKSPCPSAKKGFEMAFDEATFDGSEVFASTPGIGQRQAEVLPDDDSAMME